LPCIMAQVSRSVLCGSCTSLLCLVVLALCLYRSSFRLSAATLAPLMVVEQPAPRVAPQCQLAMDSYCQLGCYDNMSSRPCDGPMVARLSGPGRPRWRCFSPSALEGNQTYAGRSGCYCSRHAELIEVQTLCSSDIKTIFSFKMAGSECYRIPVLIHVPSGGPGTLIAFSEQRLRNCSDNSSSNIVLRRSLDSGESWEPRIIMVVQGGGLALSNPNPVVVTFPNGTRAVLLHYDTMNNPNVTHGSNLQRWSLDNGLTWTEAVNITSFMPQGYAGCMPGPSPGIFNAENGRIYFSCHGFGRNAFLYWSVDWGKSWQHSSVHSGLLDECSIALLTNGSIAMNCRTKRRHRVQLTCGANGEFLSEIMEPQGLIDPNCQGSLVSVRQTARRGLHDSADRLFLSNDNTTFGRSRITVKRSVDAGATWDSGHLAWPGPSGYSQLAVWEHEDGSGRHWMGLLFELGSEVYWRNLGFRRWVLEERGGPGAADGPPVLV